MACILKVDEALMGLLMPLGSSLDVGIQRTLDLPVLELQSSIASGIPSESEKCPGS